MAPTAWHECQARQVSVIFALPEQEPSLHPSPTVQSQWRPSRDGWVPSASGGQPRRPSARREGTRPRVPRRFLP
ncbi:hypothetical protein KXD40_001153 [Peronospora effusa]|nr:hypothetical protein KXD40_001153 [Peronospora effusa]